MNLAFLLAPLHVINRLFENLSCDRCVAEDIAAVLQREGPQALGQLPECTGTFAGVERGLIQKGRMLRLRHDDFKPFGTWPAILMPRVA